MHTSPISIRDSLRWITPIAFFLVMFLMLPLSASAQLENDIDAALQKSGIEPAPAAPASDEGLNLLTLLFKGGLLMIPIGAMSIIVVMLVIERTLALRRERVMPSGLVDELGELGTVPGVMDPRQAYRLCQQFPSSTAVVIRSMLLKTGRPQSEVEHAVSEASEREAERLYANVRWLNLIAAIAPLVGLFGTVWGMIQAFFDTTQMTAGQNKADFLAQGIYVALVTTLAGLAVAIPSAIFAHYFEGRIQRLFHEVDELLFNLLPQIERYEGRMRVTPHSLDAKDEDLAGVKSAKPDSANIA